MKTGLVEKSEKTKMEVGEAIPAITARLLSAKNTQVTDIIYGKWTKFFVIKIYLIILLLKEDYTFPQNLCKESLSLEKLYI